MNNKVKPKRAISKIQKNLLRLQKASAEYLRVTRTRGDGTTAGYFAPANRSIQEVKTAEIQLRKILIKLTMTKNQNVKSKRPSQMKSVVIDGRTININDQDECKFAAEELESFGNLSLRNDNDTVETWAILMGAKALARLAKSKVMKKPVCKSAKPKECKGQPAGCRCDPSLWYGFFGVCRNYIANADYSDSRCKTCEHGKSCHRTKGQV